MQAIHEENHVDDEQQGHGTTQIKRTQPRGKQKLLL
jgi:hypothetical protein